MSQKLSDVHWTKDALCKFDKRFMSYDLEEVARSKEICLKCPVQAECIMATAEIDSSFVAGATSKYDRLVMQWKRVDNIDDSNFGGPDRYVPVVLRRIRKAIRAGSQQ